MTNAKDLNKTYSLPFLKSKIQWWGEKSQAHQQAGVTSAHMKKWTSLTSIVSVARKIGRGN